MCKAHRVAFQPHSQQCFGRERGQTQDPKCPREQLRRGCSESTRGRKSGLRLSREVLGFAIGVELTFQIDGGSFFSSRTRSIPCVSTPIFASSLIERQISENSMRTTFELTHHVSPALSLRKKLLFSWSSLARLTS
jgi:hypothetical protein